METTGKEIVLRLKHLVQSERKITAEILEYLKEVDRRRIYLEFGATSLFGFATEYLGYSPQAAQRRIDACRMLQDLPEIKKDLEEGTLNLSQVSLVAQSLRQKAKAEPEQKLDAKDKLELFADVKGRDFSATQKIVSQKLNLEAKDFEKTRVQKDESVRLEITLTREQMKDLERVKELLSHSMPAAGWADLIAKLASDYRKRKDPLTKDIPNTEANIAGEAGDTLESRLKSQDTPIGRLTSERKALPNRVRREVFRRDRFCRHKNPDGSRCGSKFQLQIQHRQPKWSGGGDGIGNLELMCAVHNRAQYRKEAQLKWV